jgi:hypothetical protein
MPQARRRARCAASVVPLPAPWLPQTRVAQEPGPAETVDLTLHHRCTVQDRPGLAELHGGALLDEGGPRGAGELLRIGLGVAAIRLAGR